MKYLKLFENYEMQIKGAYLKLSKNYSCSLDSINKGYCDEISYDVIKNVVGKNNYKTIHDTLLSNLPFKSDLVYEIDDGVFWSNDPISKYLYKGDYWNLTTLGKFGLPPFDLEKLNTFILKGHVWIYYNGKHYDVEAIDGVYNFWDLPIYQRQLKELSLI
jgi:hypothetical protein